MKSSINWLLNVTRSRSCYMSFDTTGGGEPPPPSGGGGEKTYTESEVSARVEAARRDEKAKLYEELNGLRKAKDLTLTEADGLKGQLATATQQFDALKASSDDLQKKYDALVAAQTQTGSVDIEKLIKEVTQRVASSYEEAGGKTMATLQRELEQLRADKRRSDLESYRQRKLAEAGTEVIAELVRGSSEEEIDRSVQDAKDAYVKYIKRMGGAPAGGNPPPPPPPPPPPGTPTGTPPPPNPTLDGFARPGNRREYAKNRDKVLAEVRQRFK